VSISLPIAGLMAPGAIPSGGRSGLPSHLISQGNLALRGERVRGIWVNVRTQGPRLIVTVRVELCAHQSGK
jgi:hypothetical protein